MYGVELLSSGVRSVSSLLIFLTSFAPCTRLRKACAQSFIFTWQFCLLVFVCGSDYLDYPNPLCYFTVVTPSHLPPGSRNSQLATRDSQPNGTYRRGKTQSRRHGSAQRSAPGR